MREDTIKCCVLIEAWSYQEETKCAKLMTLLSRCCLECFCLTCMGTVFDGGVRCGILPAEVLIEKPLFIFVRV